MINNRQAGRRRGRGNNNGGGNGGGGGQRQSGGQGRDTANRIDNRARGNASQLYEKYKNLARDAQMQGDRVNIEYYLQFADHYFRVLSEQRSRFEESQPQHQHQPRRQQPFDLDGDDDYGDEGEPIRNGEQQGQPDGNRADGNRHQGNGQDREDRQPRGDAQRYEPRGEGQRPQRARDDAREGQPREAQSRDDQSRDGQPRVDYRESAPRDTQRRTPRVAMNGTPSPEGEDGYPRPVVAPANDLVTGAPETQDDQPRRRGRPRRDRSAEGEVAVPAALDADRLPPSLGISASIDAGDEAVEEKPRRRRVRAASGEATQAS